MAEEGHFAGGKDFFGEGGGQLVEGEAENIIFDRRPPEKSPPVGKSPAGKMPSFSSLSHRPIPFGYRGRMTYGL